MAYASRAQKKLVGSEIEEIHHSSAAPSRCSTAITFWAWKNRSAKAPATIGAKMAPQFMVLYAAPTCRPSKPICSRYVLMVTNHEPQIANCRNIIADSRARTLEFTLASLMAGRHHSRYASSLRHAGGQKNDQPTWVPGRRRRTGGRSSDASGGRTRSAAGTGCRQDTVVPYLAGRMVIQPRAVRRQDDQSGFSRHGAP